MPPSADPPGAELPGTEISVPEPGRLTPALARLGDLCRPVVACGFRRPVHGFEREWGS